MFITNDVLLAVCVFECAKSLSRDHLFATPWTIALQAPLSMGFSRQEYWSGLPFPPSGIFPTQGSNLSPAISYTGRQILYHRTTWEALWLDIPI